MPFCKTFCTPNSITNIAVKNYLILSIFLVNNVLAKFAKHQISLFFICLDIIFYLDIANFMKFFLRKKSLVVVDVDCCSFISALLSWAVENKLRSCEYLSKSAGDTSPAKNTVAIDESVWATHHIETNRTLSFL